MMHGKTDWDGSNHLLNTETLTESTVRANGIRVEYFPMIQHVAAQ